MFGWGYKDLKIAIDGANNNVSKVQEEMKNLEHKVTELDTRTTGIKESLDGHKIDFKDYQNKQDTHHEKVGDILSTIQTQTAVNATEGKRNLRTMVMMITLGVSAIWTIVQLIIKYIIPQ